MLTDQLRAAGWREYPGDDVRRKGEEKELRWMVVGTGVDDLPRILRYGDIVGSYMLWRPVDRMGDHAPYLWAAVTGESLEPGERQWTAYWWNGFPGNRFGWKPVMAQAVDGDIEMGILGRQSVALFSEVGGVWGGRCGGMPEGER